MASYLFILGRTPDLAFLELKTFLPDITLLRPEVAKNSHTVPIEMLGGTVKIAESVGEIASISVESLSEFILPGSTFGISMIGAGKISRDTLDGIKKRTGASRFVEAREGSALSSVVVEKKHVTELIVVKKEDTYVVGRTISVQPFEEWSKRDFGRPFADPKAGMLPPKVARMVVNIAGVGRGKMLLDPFCGMGTILSEALLVGWNVIGGDQLPGVIEKARANLRWLTGTHKLGVTYRLVISDAVHISEHLDRAPIDAIVTEPFMGPTTLKNVKNTIKGLEKLYIGCLRDWQKVLKPKGVVMMAIPKYEQNGKTYFVKKVIDMCENLGYTIQAGPIEYGRSGAVVKRLFYLFQKN